MSFDSSRKKQEQAAPASSRPQPSKRVSQRARCTLRATIAEYIFDHRSQNHSPKTIEWHSTALGKLADFLEKQKITYIDQIEKVHLLSWLNALSTNRLPGASNLQNAL